MMKTSNIFSYAEYIQFIKHIKNLGKVTSVGDWDGKNSIILRHDVDLDIFPAYELAKIEAKCNIKSSYYVLTSGFSYNPASKENRILLKKIHGMGFEIGLHFDPTVYGNLNEKDLNAEFVQECEFLESIIDQNIHSFSFHNPSLMNTFPVLDTNLRSAYDPEIFSNGLYLSDSQMEFRGLNPYDFVEQVKNNTIQILLHPFHYSEDGATYPELFSRYILRHLDSIDKVLQVNQKYSELLPDSLLRYFLSKFIK